MKKHTSIQPQMAFYVNKQLRESISG